MAVSFHELFRAEQIVLELSARTEAEVVREIVARMCAAGRIADEAAFADAVLDRESRSSTNTGDAIAFPHARTDLVDELMLGIGRSKAGVKFSGPDAPVHLVFLLGVPKGLVTDYLVCVGTIARIVKPRERREALMNATSAEQFADILRNSALLLE